MGRGFWSVSFPDGTSGCLRGDGVAYCDREGTLAPVNSHFGRRLYAHEVEWLNQCRQVKLNWGNQEGVNRLLRNCEKTALPFEKGVQWHPYTLGGDYQYRTPQEYDAVQLRMEKDREERRTRIANWQRANSLRTAQEWADYLGEEVEISRRPWEPDSWVSASGKDVANKIVEGGWEVESRTGELQPGYICFNVFGAPHVRFTPR